MSAATLTRRAALSGAVASVAAVATVAAVAMPIGAPAAASGVSSEMGALLAAAKAASAAVERHDAEVVEPAAKRYQAEAARIERDQPHVTVSAGLRLGADGRTFEPGFYSTSNASEIEHTAITVRLARRGVGGSPERVAAARRLQAAHLRRTRAIHQATARARIASGFAAAHEQYDALGRVWSDAQEAVCAYPVRTAADLAAKIACVVEWEFEGMMETLLADARRVAKMEG